MANVVFSPGSLYIVEPTKSFEPIEPIVAEIESFDFEEDYEYANGMPCISFLDMVAASFECTAALSREAIMAIYGIREAVLRCCPNKRVVHLAFYAKKPRTRKKNFNRAIKILEELA